MINVSHLSLRELSADYFLYCSYTPHTQRGNCLLEGCNFNSGGYQKFIKRNKLIYYNNYIGIPVPIYKPDFMGRREIVFRYGTIFISDSITTDPNKDYSNLINKRLYLFPYYSETNRFQTALMIRGNQKRLDKIK